MRKFTSYGPINRQENYYAPRTVLIEHAIAQLRGDGSVSGGHYITVWAPRQTGKTWIMQEVLVQLSQESMYDVVKLNLQSLIGEDIQSVIRLITQKLADELQKALPIPQIPMDLEKVFDRDTLTKPLILILDEFDTLSEDAIRVLVSVFRNIYIERRQRLAQAGRRPETRLHGLALIGVRAVLGIDNPTGSPFNVQRGLHIPNLTHAEVDGMFKWYAEESGQVVEQAVIDRLFYETQGQPGLIGWFGELLTETYNRDATQPITNTLFDEVYAAALYLLPNNNILNIVSKAKQSPYRQTVLELFRTGAEVPFAYDDPHINYLYMNGVIDAVQVTSTEYQVKFANPFVQKRLFNYLAREIFPNPGVLHDPFADLSAAITENALFVKPLMRLYEQYFQTNRSWLLKDVPRRKTDERVYEAVYHFNLYTYLYQFLRSYDAHVTPEFPTGNGKVDLLIHHAGQQYAIEDKSFVNQREYQKALHQAAYYAHQLNLSEIALVFFVDHVDDTNRQKFETIYMDPATNIRVFPILVATGPT